MRPVLQTLRAVTLSTPCLVELRHDVEPRHHVEPRQLVDHVNSLSHSALVSRYIAGRT